VWLWECENHPKQSDWGRDKLRERFYGCVDHLVQSLETGRLPQYFNPRNNLLREKDSSGIASDAAMIREFLHHPPQLRTT